eukprot:scaffold5306_cov67-Cyclotella_meneghiniana.AAC.13
MLAIGNRRHCRQCRGNVGAVTHIFYLGYRMTSYPCHTCCIVKYVTHCVTSTLINLEISKTRHVNCGLSHIVRSSSSRGAMDVLRTADGLDSMKGIVSDTPAAAGCLLRQLAVIIVVRLNPQKRQ